MKELVGKQVFGVEKSRDNTVVRFETNEEPVSYRCEGDCCSTTWVEHMRGVENLKGDLVLEVLESETVDDPEDKTDELVQVYQVGLRTARGEFWIEFRNASNGFYGGSLELGGTRAKVFPVQEDF